MEDPLPIVELENSSNNESDASSFFRDFKNTFCRMHVLWTEIDKRSVGSIYGEFEKYFEPRGRELSAGFNTLAPRVTNFVKLYEQKVAEDDKLQQMVKDTKRRLEEESKKAEEAIKLNETLQQAFGGHSKGEHQDPHVSIEFSTIFDLGTKGEGWKVNLGNPEKVKELMKTKIMTVGVLGAYDAGKTHLCNKLGNKNLRSGHQHRTAGIEVIYPEEKDVYYGLIDVPGSQEAHHINDKNLIAKLPRLPSKTKEEEIKAEDGEKANNTYLERYNLLHNDAKLTHSLKEKFIVENVDIVIIVTNKLSESDQEMIYKNLNYFKEWQEQSKKGITTHKYLYVVHNFKMLSRIEDVEEQIEKDIKMCFDVEESPIFVSNRMENCNNVMYRDQFGVSHLVLATENSEAGKYYNTSTIEFLKSKIRNNDTKSTLNLVESFQKFCNIHLPIMVGQEIELVYDEEKKAFINSKKTDIKIDGLAWTSLGEVILNTGFKPKYSILKNTLDNGDLELIVEVESIDCEPKDPKAVKDLKPNQSYIMSRTYNKDGFDCLKLKGAKHIYKGATDAKGSTDAKETPDGKDPKNKAELINYSRGEGGFEMVIPLVKNKTKQDYQMVDLKNGITRHVFRFSGDADEEEF